MSQSNPKRKAFFFIIQSEDEWKAKSHQRQHQLHIKKFFTEQWSLREHHLCLPAEPHSQLNQSLGSEQPHGWPKCSHHNVIVIVLPSNVKGISFQYREGIEV